MPGPKVVLVAPPTVACRNPAVMEYGGVERVAARLAWMLATLGCEMVPVAAADSDFGPGVTTRCLSPEPAWCTPGRFPTVYTEDVATLLDRFGEHVGGARSRPSRPTPCCCSAPASRCSAAPWRSSREVAR
jgi:hypothetical protein